MKWDEFFSWEQASRDSIDVKKIYIDMAGDLVTGVLLSQIVYWFLPSRRGESKLHVEKDGVIWLAKKVDDWWDECRVSAKQARRAIAALKARGIIETRICKFAGVPTTHIRLTEGFLDLLTEATAVRANPLCPKVQMDYAQRDKSIMPKGTNPLTEITSEITSETDSRPLRGRDTQPPTGQIDSANKEGKEKRGSLRETADTASSHPAITAFRQAVHRYPAKSWYQNIVDTVGDKEDSVDRWRALVHEWVGHGWNPLNVSAMLEAYRTGGIKPKANAPPANNGNGNGRPTGKAAIEAYLRGGDSGVT